MTTENNKTFTYENSKEEITNYFNTIKSDKTFLTTFNSKEDLIQKYDYFKKISLTVSAEYQKFYEYMILITDVAERFDIYEKTMFNEKQKIELSSAPLTKKVNEKYKKANIEENKLDENNKIKRGRKKNTNTVTKTKKVANKKVSKLSLPTVDSKEKK